MLYDINGNVVYSDDINCKIIAHRGYFVDVIQNTIPAFKSAHKNGFRWIEVDVHRCTDGFYILSHDTVVTLYNSGSPVRVDFRESAYETIKGYTWDSAGVYKLNTLQAALNTLMTYDMRVILDIKSGTNAELMYIAAMCGATDRVMLSYTSFSRAYADRDLLNQYDNVPVRCVPSDFSNFANLKAAIANPLYADVNSTVNDHWQKYLNIALSCGLPIIFSGCTTSNYERWCVLANGAMANSNDNIPYSTFFDLLTNDYDHPTTITPSAQSLSLDVNGTETLSGTSDLNDAGGYVYMYSVNPSIATVTQTVFGQTGTATITGKSAGSTVIRMFDGCGEIVDVSITVT